MRHSVAVARKVVFSGATTPPLLPYTVSAICNIRRQLRKNIQFQMRPRPAVTIKLAVKYATFGRCGEKSCVFRCNHATTVAVYCQYYMQYLAAVARKTYSVIYNHGPVFQKNTNTIFKTPDHSSRILSVLYATTWSAVALKFAVTDATSGGSCEKNLQLHSQIRATVAIKTCCAICDHGPQ